MTIPSSDDVKEAAKGIVQNVDEGFTSAAHTLAHGAATVQATATQTYDGVLQYLDHAQEYVQHGVDTARSVEDTAISGLKSAILYTANNPAIAYPALGATAVLAIPATRRLLWRLTLGRLVRPEAVIQSAETKVESLRSRIPDFGSEAQKLEERMLAAEEELKRSYSKLKSTRLELQRLASNVDASQRVALGVVRDLRPLKLVDGSLAVRGEAAQQAAQLKATLARVRKNVARIVNQDV